MFRLHFQRMTAMMTQPTLSSARLAPPRVLIADDQQSISEALVFLLKMQGIHTDVVSSPAEVLQRVRERQYDLLLMDMNYEKDTTSGAEGLRLVDAVRNIDPGLGMVVMTAWSTVEIAVAALQRGAADFIQKPWDNDNAARVIAEQIAATARRRQERSISQAEQEQAKQVQRRLMGETSAVIGPFTVAAESRSSRLVGGDFFDARRLADGRLLICVADVMGKGMGAALLMSNFQAQFRAIAARSTSAQQITTELNRSLREQMGGHLVTSFVGILDPVTMTASFTSAGHPPAFLTRANGSIEMLTSDDAVLGGVADWDYRAATVALNKGDRLLVVSDGCLEAANQDGEEAGEGAVQSWLRASVSSGANEMKEHLVARLLEFANHQLADDATLMVVAVD